MPSLDFGFNGNIYFNLLRFTTSFTTFHSGMHRYFFPSSLYRLKCRLLFYQSERNPLWDTFYNSQLSFFYLGLFLSLMTLIDWCLCELIMTIWLMNIWLGCEYVYYFCEILINWTVNCYTVGQIGICTFLWLRVSICTLLDVNKRGLAITFGKNRARAEVFIVYT